MDLRRVTRGDWSLAGVAVLLAIDLLFLPWLDFIIPIPVRDFSVSITSTATGAPDGWSGVVAVIAALAVVGDLAVERLSDTRLPAVAGSRPLTRLVLACVAALFVLLKFLSFTHDSLFGFGLWTGGVLAIALVAVAARERYAAVRLPVGGA
jgi:hypothetical protein